MTPKSPTREKPSPAAVDPGGTVCQHIGLAEDRASHEDRASRQHRCYFTASPQRIDVDHQRNFCLRAASSDCPWLTIDDLPFAVRAAEPDDRETLEQAARTMADGVRTVAQVTSPILKEMAERAAGAIHDGAEAIQERIAAQVARGEPGEVAGETPAAKVEQEEEPPAYRILTPPPPPAHGLSLTPRRQWWAPLVELLPDLAAFGAFLAALFWLSGIYRAWLPIDISEQAFWPRFELPVVPMTMNVDVLELTFDVGVLIPPALGALWAWLAFDLLKREGLSVVTAAAVGALGMFALSRYVDGPVAGEFGMLFQALPVVVVLFQRATVGRQLRRAVMTW